MADETIRRFVEDDDLVHAPEPYDHLIASPVFSPIWGRGWLGYAETGDRIDLWYVNENASEAASLDYAKLYTYNDRAQSHLWLIMESVRTVRWGFVQAIPFLLCPPEDAVLFPLPARLVRFLETLHD